MLYVSLFGLLVLMVWLFTRKRKTTPVVNTTRPDMLHGHDLNKWHYLGFVELTLNETEYPTFLFVNKDNYSKRSYTIGGSNPERCRKYHSYVSKHLEPWSKGEYELYTLCNSPSRWLQEFMLDKFTCEWDKETQWWKSTNAAKYKSAQNKQTKKTPPNKGSGGQKDPVIIKVDFGKKDDES